MEDISGIIMMVMLSTIAAQALPFPVQNARQYRRAGLFLIICFVCGIFFLPTFFRKVSRYLTSETLLIFRWVFA
ncbi:MAG: hypothetical protein ACLRXQ_11035 [Phascolarctobacterium faecium]